MRVAKEFQTITGDLNAKEVADALGTKDHDDASRIHAIARRGVTIALSERDRPPAEVAVKATTHATGALVIVEGEKDPGPYVLVVVETYPSGAARVMLRGWMRRDAACLPKYRREPGDDQRPGVRSPCYWIPQRNLSPMAEIRAEIDAVHRAKRKAEGW